MSQRSADTASAKRVEPTRTQFRSLLAANPNYFGNLPEFGFKAVKKIAGNTTYEELTSVGYLPSKGLLEATIDVKQSAGYGGGLCGDGSLEHVRFYVDLGGGWTDAGTTAAKVHDIAAGKDCAGKAEHPLSFSVELPYQPRRRWCTAPQLPKVRAILSWNLEPPPGQPDWTPVYGNVQETHIQIAKGFFLSDWVFTLIESDIKIPKELLATLPLPEPLPDPFPGPLPGPGPFPPEPFPPGPFPPEPFPEPGPGGPPLPKKLELAELTQLYAKEVTRGKPKFTVEPERFAFAELQPMMTKSLPLSAVTGFNLSMTKLELDIGAIVAAIDKTKGNVSYEELEDLGLDRAKRQIVATYRVKQASGFSGGLCTAGSTEYVAFWADWGDDCSWTYLGTEQVSAYDFTSLPTGGLSYSAVLPVDLDGWLTGCEEPRVARIRAVLSWNSPPSTTDPDAVPTWGNRLDAHVLLPATASSGNLRVIGGIQVEDIHDVTGYTLPDAEFQDVPFKADALGRPCPFGGTVVVRGPEVPGGRYRIWVTVDGGPEQLLVAPVRVNPWGGSPFWHSPDADLWFSYLGFLSNPSGVLAAWPSQGELAVIRLEVEGLGSESQRVRIDNTQPEVEVAITDPIGDCGLIGPGTMMSGTVTATDTHLGSWSLVMDGGPASFPAVGIASGSTNVSGLVWTTAGPSEQCGYVVQVGAVDRSIVNSSYGAHNQRWKDIGFCVIV